jgi:predicted nucleotidyltransferase
MNQKKVDKILETLATLNEKENIEILFAVESGSRAWGLDSKDSDYDVRFVFVRGERAYLGLKKPKDVIEFTDKEEDIDVVGFDIYKFFHLLTKSNPCVIEWVTSPIVYIDHYDFRGRIAALIAKHVNPLALYHHYRSMCKQNYLKYIHGKLGSSYKKYLYAMRGLANARYVRKYRTIPPVLFENTLDKILLSEDAEIDVLLHDIIEVKRGKKEQDEVKIPHFDIFIESFLKEEGEPPSEMFLGHSELEGLLMERVR